jgi:hypothetical protein
MLRDNVVTGYDHGVRAVSGDFPSFGGDEFASELRRIVVPNGFFVDAAGTGFVGEAEEV